MTPEILREGGDQIIVVEAGSGEAGDAAATSGRSEPCFAYKTSRFDFFERPIFLPNKISRKDNGRPQSVSAFCDCNGVFIPMNRSAAQCWLRFGVTVKLSHVLRRTVFILAPWPT
jgi:hypothetical protein